MAPKLIGMLTGDDINHRIAMVGFATGSYTESSSYPAYGNTELFIGSTEYNYNTTASSYYNSAFQDMNTTTGYNNVIASKEALAARGATCVDLGINMANGIFNAYKSDYQYDEATESWNRNRVMIVFTDGEPAQYSGYSSDVANNAINNANTTKKRTELRSIQSAFLPVPMQPVREIRMVKLHKNPTGSCRMFLPTMVWFRIPATTCLLAIPRP